MERYEINEPTEGEQMSLEEELAQQEAARQPELSGQEEVQEQPEETQEEQPEDLILGKFKSQEDLVKAYENLEKKFSEEHPKKEEQPESESEPPTTPDVSNAIQEASNAFEESGELSEDNYKALEDNGIPREFVEAYVKGQQATVEAEATAITDSIGGQDNYDAMVEWAKGSLSKDEVESYDDMVTKGSQNSAMMAVKGLYARFVGETGQQPVKIAQGQTAGAVVQPFSSNRQIVEAMKDSRYDSDPAYRSDVEQRISVSNL